MTGVVDADTHIAESEAMWKYIDEEMHPRRPILAKIPAGNAVQAATLQPPSTILGAQLTYRELLDLSKSGLDYQNTVVLTTKSLVKRSPDTFRRFMRAYFCGLSGFS